MTPPESPESQRAMRKWKLDSTARNADEAREVVLRAVAEKRRKPPKSMRTPEGKLAMREEIAPLRTRPTGEIPPVVNGEIWTEARKRSFLFYIASGGLLTEWCKAAGVGDHAPYCLAKKDPEFAADFDEARALRIDVLAEEALSIATQPRFTEELIETTAADGSVVSAVKRYDNVYARKLAFSARMDLLKKWAPDRYGEVLKTAMSDDRASQILAARKRIQAADVDKKE